MQGQCVAGLVLLAGLASIQLVPAAATAHFVLESPAAAFEQDPLGSPQFDGPCGDDGVVASTGALTSYGAGETIEITIDETIYHPGHYRVALALNDPSELPPDPVVTPGPLVACGVAEVQEPPVFPILADGVLDHDASFGAPQTISVTVPNVTCDRCTLQVIEFQSSHSAPCFHYHCAEIRIPEPGAGLLGMTGVLSVLGLAPSRRRRASQSSPAPE